MIEAADDRRFEQPIFHIRYPGSWSADPAVPLRRSIAISAALSIPMRRCASSAGWRPIPMAGTGAVARGSRITGSTPVASTNAMRATWRASGSAPSRAELRPDRSNDQPSCRAPADRPNRRGHTRSANPGLEVRSRGGRTVAATRSCPISAAGRGIEASRAGMKTRLATRVQPRLIRSSCPCSPSPDGRTRQANRTRFRWSAPRTGSRARSPSPASRCVRPASSSRNRC